MLPKLLKFIAYMSSGGHLFLRSPGVHAGTRLTQKETQVRLHSNLRSTWFNNLLFLLASQEP